MFHIKLRKVRVKLSSQYEKEIAEEFNRYFVDKISGLKKNIDPNRIKDPLEKLQEKWQTKT